MWPWRKRNSCRAFLTRDGRGKRSALSALDAAVRRLYHALDEIDRGLRRSGRRRTPSPARLVRNDHGGDGRDHRRGDLHQSLHRRGTRPYFGADPERVDRRRADRARRWIHLCGTGGAAAGRRRTIRVSARGIASRGGVRLRLGPAARHSDRWNGGGRGHLCAIFSGVNAMADQRLVSRGGRTGAAYRDQLPRRARGQPRAIDDDADSDRRDRRARRSQFSPRRKRRRFPGSRFSINRPP